VVALAKTAAAEVAVAGLGRDVGNRRCAAISVQKEVVSQLLHFVDVLQERLVDFCGSLYRRTPPIADVTTKVAARIAPHRRLQKTSVAGSSGPRSDPASLRGIDEYEKRGAVVVENAHLEETQIAHASRAENDAGSVSLPLSLGSGARM
jgi:hypothetical protein